MRNSQVKRPTETATMTDAAVKASACDLPVATYTLQPVNTSFTDFKDAANRPGIMHLSQTNVQYVDGHVTSVKNVNLKASMLKAR